MNSNEKPVSAFAPGVRTHKVIRVKRELESNTYPFTELIEVDPNEKISLAVLEAVLSIKGVETCWHCGGNKTCGTWCDECVRKAGPVAVNSVKVPEPECSKCNGTGHLLNGRPFNPLKPAVRDHEIPILASSGS